jgi:hypothetical protein
VPTRLIGIPGSLNGRVNKAWYPAKHHGLGWGFPNCWQGWAVLAAWALLIAGGTVLLRPDVQPVAYVVYDTILTPLLLVTIVAKGERLRWRWYDDSDRKPGRI